MLDSIHKSKGEKLELFIFNPLAPGQAIWLPKGKVMMDTLSKILSHLFIQNGTKMISSATLGSKLIWDKTQHSCKYENNMFAVDDLYIKPMNCPMHMMVAEKMYNYRSKLPISISEFNYCYRKECSGSLNGLLRLFRFTQDDTHTICQHTDVDHFLDNFFSYVKTIYFRSGFETFTCRLSNVDKDYIGDIDQSNVSKSVLFDYLKNNKIDFYEDNSGAFYGPKIDLIVKDKIQREWQLGTVQVDLCMLKNICFPLNNNDNYHNTFVLHSAVLGSFERFIAILLETFDRIPSFVNPYKVLFIPMKNNEIIDKYVMSIKKKINDMHLYDICDVDDANKDYRIKIASGYTYNYEYIVLVGEKEANNNSLTVTNCLNNERVTFSLNNFFDKINEQIYEERYSV